MSSLEAAGAAAAGDDPQLKPAKKPEWDPYKVLPSGTKPPKDCIRRIRKDIKTLFKEPLPGICVCVDESDMTLLHAVCGVPLFRRTTAPINFR